MYNVFYETARGTHKYCVNDMPLEVAEDFAEKCRRRYQNPDGTPKPYPNGRGVYDVTDVRVERTSL